MSFKILEDYFVTDQEAAEALNVLEKYLDPKGKTYNIPTGKVEESTRILDYSLHLFESISKSNKEKISTLAERLVDHHRTHTNDLSKMVVINQLFTHYVNSNIAAASIQHIAIAVGPARKLMTISEDELIRSIKITSLLLYCFDILPEGVKEDIHQTAQLLILTPQELKESSELHQIKQLFKGVSLQSKNKQNKPTDSIQSMQQAMRKICRPPEGRFDSFCELPNSLSDAEEKQLNERLMAKEEFKQKVIDRIADFVYRFQHDYVSKVIFNLPEVEQLFHDRLKNLLPKIAPRIFVHTPRLPSSLEKQLIVDVIKNITLFFQDFTEAATETNHVKLKVYNLIRKRLKLTEEKPFGPLQLQLQLIKHVENILDLIMYDENEPDEVPSLERQCFLMLTSPLIVGIMNRLIDPDIVIYIVNRTVKGNIWSSIEEPYSLPLKAFDGADDEFSLALGESIATLCKHLFKFGTAKGAINLLGKMASKILESKKKELGNVVQRALEKITSAECLVDPIRFVDMLLFEHSDGKITPTLGEYLNQTSDKMEEKRGELKAFLENEYIPKTINTIKKMAKGSAFILNRDSTKQFYREITNRLWMLITDRDLLLALVFYLLDGINISLEKEIKHLIEQRHSNTKSIRKYN